LWALRSKPYKPQFVQATDANKRKFQNDYHPDGYSLSSLLAGVTIAAKVDPDLIWIVGAPNSRPDENTFVNELHELAPAFHGRIDTAADFVLHSADDLHFMWRVAHETGGVCVDKEGHPIDEPPVPLSAPTLPIRPEPQTPTMLRDKP
jgi:hypothetical protein